MKKRKLFVLIFITYWCCAVLCCVRVALWRRSDDTNVVDAYEFMRLTEIYDLRFDVRRVKKRSRHNRHDDAAAAAAAAAGSSGLDDSLNRLFASQDYWSCSERACFRFERFRESLKTFFDSFFGACAKQQPKKKNKFYLLLFIYNH